MSDILILNQQFFCKTDTRVIAKFSYFFENIACFMVLIDLSIVYRLYSLYELFEFRVFDLGTWSDLKSLSSMGSPV